MTEHIDVELISAHDPDTGETVEAVRIPEGYVALLMPQDDAERYAAWTEVKAIRITVEDDLIAALEVSDDLEWLTDPEAGADA